MQIKQIDKMKKILIIIAFVFIIELPVFCAQEVITLDTSTEPSFVETVVEEQEQNTEGPFIQAPKQTTELKNGIVDYDPSHGAVSPKFFLLNVLSNTAKDVYNLQVERTDIPSQLLKDQLTFKLEKGPVENIHIWSAYQMNFSETLTEQGDNHSKFDMCLINVLFDGKFKGGKEDFRIMLDPTHRHSHMPFMEPFIQDLYIRTNRIPHHTLMIGNSRPGVGIEGAQSPYTLAFINRSQISRNLANIRKFGFRLNGDYSLVDYDLGIYSSSTNFSSFFPGHEFDAWMNVKPLGKTDGKYGKLVTGAGLQSGEKHGMSYYLTGAYAGYEYKKFWTKFEYARANGSNGGSGLTDKRSQGLFVTAAYHLTKKLELLVRYDQFDPDREIRNNNQKEFTLGTNYYLKSQALKLIFNYVYCQNDSKADSHRLMMGTQIVL